MKTKCMVLKTAVMVIVPLLLLVSILGVPFAKVYATGTIVGIESAEDVEAGSVFVLSIYLENVIKATGIGAPANALTWDPSVLILQGVTINPLAPEGSSIFASKIDNSEGSMTFALINDNQPEYITVNGKTPILDLSFVAIGSPGDTTILKLDNLQLSYEDYMVYPPDVIIDGFVSIYTEIISISVEPSDIDFDSIVQGQSSESQTITITSTSNVDVYVTASITGETTPDFYDDNLELEFEYKTYAVSGFEMNILVNEPPKVVGVILSVPLNAPTGLQEGTLVFWAETP